MDLKVLKFDGTDVLVPQAFYVYQKNMVNVMKVENERFTALVVRGAGKAENFEGTIDDLKELLNPSGEIRHKMFDSIRSIIQMGEALYLYGPAGTGKNVICQQLAKELKLDFYFSNAVTFEYKINGYGDAQGRFVETQFYKAFAYGGLFMLDEMDASCAGVLITLNAALANGYFDFPVLGRVDAHPDFRVIAAGNTIGKGGTDGYEERVVLDPATLNRFGAMKIDYDERIEKRVANGDDELVEFVHQLRHASKMSGIQMVVSYRDISRLVKFLGCFTMEEALDWGLLKGMPDDDVAVLYGNIENKNNRFAKGLRTFIA